MNPAVNDVACQATLICTVVVRIAPNGFSRHTLQLKWKLEGKNNKHVLDRSIIEDTTRVVISYE